MNPDDLARILDELGKRLGPSGEYVFGLALRQVYVEAAVGTIFLVLTLVPTVIVLPKIYRWGKGRDGDEVMALLSGLLVAFLPAIGAYNFLAYDLPRLLNPEYFALTDILSRIVP